MQPVAPDGYMSVPPGRLATIVTSLEMTSRPLELPGFSATAGTELQLIRTPGLDWYRALFRLVGGEWLWFSRLRLDDRALAAIIHDPGVQVHEMQVAGKQAGILELDFREPEQCEISFFGIAPQFTGQRLGSYLMSETINRAWDRPINRLWVHTCTLDHPAALQFYRKMGFRAFKQQVEVAIDPRVSGELPRTLGKHIPIYDP